MAKKASDNLKYYHNPNGPTIGTVSRRVIEKDGLTFKDIDGTGEVTPVNDWRLSPAERAAAYVKTLTTDEKIAQLFISDWRMGPACPAAGHTVVPDESGVLDDAEFNGKTIFRRAAPARHHHPDQGLVQPPPDPAGQPLPRRHGRLAQPAARRRRGVRALRPGAGGLQLPQ